MQLQEETACIAEDTAHLITSPQGRCASRAVCSLVLEKLIGRVRFRTLALRLLGSVSNVHICSSCHRRVTVSYREMKREL
jgi:hypothetical protein